MMPVVGLNNSTNSSLAVAPLLRNSLITIFVAACICGAALTGAGDRIFEERRDRGGVHPRVRGCDDRRQGAHGDQIGGRASIARLYLDIITHGGV